MEPKREKTPLLQGPPAAPNAKFGVGNKNDHHRAPSSQPAKWGSRVICSLFLVIAFFGLVSFRLYLLPETPDRPETPEPGDWSWAKVKPSRTLEWQRCYNDEYDCARLDVPLDWLDPHANEPGRDRVVLAVIRLRAKNTDDYRGPLFFNPGGPGGSGIWSMLDHGKFLQQVVGTNHDIITFDPRGVGASIPRIECWGSGQERTFWDLADVGVSDAHPGVVYDEYARSAAVSQRCETKMRESGLLEHISTVSHARDMLEILQQTGFDKLRYWGFSYGTVLGGTFAAVYPDRVERVVLDGNVDYKEWFLAKHINFLRDADKILSAFYTLCADAGPKNCAFHSPTPSAIETRFKSLLERLRNNPVIVPASNGTDGKPGLVIPELVTYTKLRRLMSTVFYRPLYMFPQFADVLAGLERGDGKPYLRMLSSGGDPDTAPPPFASFCSQLPIEPTVPLAAVVEGTADAFPAIMCADHDPWTGTAADFADLARELNEISFSVGGVGSLARAACVGRTVRPKWRFSGPFAAKTAFPVLFLANEADNVTPLVSARNNSEGFEGSVVLLQKRSYGHSTLASPSTCTAGKIRAYFQDGVVPKQGEKECEADYQPFDPSFPRRVGVGAIGEDVGLSEAMRELSRRASKSLGRHGLL